MSKRKLAKIGDYVFLSKYSDRDPHDPGYIGIIETIIENKRGYEYRCEGSYRFFPCCKKITKEYGIQFLKEYGEFNNEE